MSTSEERLRQLAAQLEADREIKDRGGREQDARQRESLQQRANTARQEAQAWHDRAQALVGATGKRVPFFMKPSVVSTE